MKKKEVEIDAIHNQSKVYNMKINCPFFFRYSFVTSLKENVNKISWKIKKWKKRTNKNKEHREKEEKLDFQFAELRTRERETGMITKNSYLASGGI